MLMLTYRPSQEWRTQASCRGTDPALWETPHYMQSASLDIDRQIELCRGCPVLRQCAADSVLAGDSGVIRAGIPICATGGVGRGRAWDALNRIARGASVDDGLALVLGGGDG